MKKIHLALTAMLLSTLIYSCKKNGVQVIDETVDPSTVAQIKYFNFGVSVPSVNFYANGTKVTGISSTTGAESAAGTATGGVYPQSGYTVLPGGAYSFKAQIPAAATADPNLAIVTLNQTLENGKRYTLYTSGIYNTTEKKSDGFIIEDKLPVYNNAVAYVRLVNTISNAPNNMSLYMKNTGATPPVTDPQLIANNIAYKTASDFIAVPIGIYELYIRYPSAPTTNVISRNSTSVVNLAGGKVYTFATRGDITVTSTTATTRPQIDFTTNR
jgi:hypothetical protein